MNTGNLSRESDYAEQECRTRHAIDEPGLRDVLHPGADQRDELAAEEELEIAMAQGAEHRGSFNRGEIVHALRFSRQEIFHGGGRVAHASYCTMPG